MISTMSALLKVFENPADINMVMTNKIGPDEIIVQLEGNTLQTQIAYSTNLCNEYKALFQLPLGGIHALKVSYSYYHMRLGGFVVFEFPFSLTPPKTFCLTFALKRLLD